MADEYKGVDLYEVLGLEAGADEKEVARAYKKKSLLHHPDRGGEVKTFLKLKHARDVLLDPKQKSEYDKKLSQELMARKRQLEREAELTSKRKKMRDDQMRKEHGAALRQQHERDETRRRHELTKLREKATARQRELQENLARQARRQSEVDKANADDSSAKGAKSERTVTFKWDRRQTSHSDESIIQALRRFGDIESVKLKASSAKVVFADKRAAIQAVRVEGHNDAWREVRLQGHIIDSDATEPHTDKNDADMSTATELPGGPISLQEHLDFERHVLQRLRERIEQHRASAASVAT